jgi:hypothetical protein
MKISFHRIACFFRLPYIHSITSPGGEMDRIRRSLWSHEPAKHRIHECAVLVESLLPIVDMNEGDVDVVHDAMLANGRSDDTAPSALPHCQRWDLCGRLAGMDIRCGGRTFGRRSSPCFEQRAAMGRCLDYYWRVTLREVFARG